MKKHTFLFSLLFAILYAVVLSFSIECLFQYIGTIGTVNIDSNIPTDNAEIIWYWTSLGAGILSTAALIAIFIFNFNLSDKLGYNKYTWWLQSAAAAVMAFFMVEPWQRLFDFLKETL